MMFQAAIDIYVAAGKDSADRIMEAQESKDNSLEAFIKFFETLKLDIYDKKSVSAAVKNVSVVVMRILSGRNIFTWRP